MARTPESIEQVVLVTGSIIHSGTEEAIFGWVNITAREGEIVSKVLADGTFAISGRPELLFPQPDSPSNKLTLDIQAHSAQFRQGNVLITREVSIPAGYSFDLPLEVGVFLLPADPVNIRGRVVKATDPAIPIVGALLEIRRGGVTINSTMTDMEGRYRLDAITVVLPVKIHCSATGFKWQERILLVDFGKTVNEEYFQLVPA